MSRRRRNWEYCSVPGSSHGLMICGACNKPIVSGEYRVRDAGDAYVTHHRVCSEPDPKWGEMDRSREYHANRVAKLADQCREFIRRTGITALDDYLDPEEIERISEDPK